MAETKYTIDAQIIKTIETVLSKGDRVEIVPVKDGVRVLRVRRKNVAKSGE